MAKIPVGNFGFQTAAVAPQGRPPPLGAFGTSAGAGDGLQAIGEALSGIAGKLLAEERQQQEEVDRSKTMVAVHGHQATVQDALDGIKEKLGTGEVSREEAPNLFMDAMKKASQEATKGVPEWMQKKAEVLFGGVEQNAMLGLGRVMSNHRRQEVSGNLDFIRDAMAKNAGIPGADIEKINSDFALTVKHLGPQAGLPSDKIGKLSQDFADSNWFNQAKLRTAVSRENLDDLKALENDLKADDGFYATRLDPDKRAILLGSVAAHRVAFENRIQHFADRIEARSDIVISKIDQQIASGVPATPEMWADWEKRTRGTSNQEAFQERLKAEQEVQGLLREPPEKQAAYLREREAALLQDGGTIRDKANIDRLRKVLDNNRKQMAEAPLVFAQNRTGEIAKPLDLAMLLDPQKGPEAAGLIADRVATVTALRRQYGDTVRLRVLLPFEAETLTKVMDGMTPDQQVEIFRAMRGAIGDDAAYRETLGQIAPDSPVKALAGTLAARGADFVREHTFSPDETIQARQTATLALLGESLIHPARGQKAQDGKTNTWIMPKKDAMLRRFIDRVGDTFAGTQDGRVQGTPSALDAQFEFVQATYAGLMASKGGVRSPEVVDAALFDQAIERTTPVMKQGGAHFLKPIVGMSDDQFREKLRAALPDELKPQSDKLPLRNVRSNQYVILNGARPLTDKAGNPLIVTVQP